METLSFQVPTSGIPQLTVPMLSKQIIPVPPLPVQKEIVRILDTFTKLTEELTTELTARKKQYEHYSNILLSFVNAKYQTLEELCDIVDYRGKTPRKVDDGIFLITAKNIRKGFIDYNKSKEYISPEDYDEVMHRGFPKIGDVLITTEAPCGNVAQIDNENVALAQRVIKYRPKSNNLNSTFLKYVLLGKEFQNKLERAATGGTVKGIKGSKLHQLIVEKSRTIQTDHVKVLRRDDGTSKNIQLIDKKNIHNNRLQVINQYVETEGNHDTRYDVTILVNGLPLVHVELKRRGVAIREAFNQIKRYQRDSFWAASGLYEYVQIFIISNGTHTKYYSNTTRNSHIKEMGESTKQKSKKTSNSFEFTSFWADGNNKVIADLIDFTNIDYILMLVEKYHAGNCEDKEILASIRKAVDASMQLRSKKELIEAFISHVNVDTQVTTDWRRFVLEQEENDLTEIITTEKLKSEETRKFVANAFRDGALKTTGTEIDKLMPPVSRFGGGGRAQKKQGVIEKLKQNHFPNPTFFVDDGYSGVDFDNRPGFQQMLTEVKTGRVGTIITKDLSRLGRNSAMTSLYINIVFPKSGVRYIAINDHFDSIDMNSTECDMAGIKNWFNEFFAKDTSRKIRAVQKAKGERGVPLTTNVPYGYVKDKENPKTWLVDPEAASVVKRIFEMCMNGRGPSQIANQLKADGVLTPTAYKDSVGIKSPNTASENPCGWNSSTVVHILERREYTGCTVNFKTYTNSIWDKKQRDNPVEKQAIFEDTHEAIIEKDVFEKVQIIRQQRQRKTKSGCTSTFSGLVYCADCGEKLYYGATNNGKREGAFFDCSLHWKHKDKCGTHFIRESVLERMVLKHIQLVMGYILRYRQHFIFVMEHQLQLESAEKLQASRKQLERNERRITELKRLFIKIYEDNAKGNLNDERYEMMSQNYEAEQKQLEAEVVALRQEIEVQERQNENIERFIRTADKYVDIEEIDPCMLRELIKAIYVEAPDKSSGKRRQKIHIEYDGIGFIPLDELAKKETA